TLQPSASLSFLLQPQIPFELNTVTPVAPPQLRWHAELASFYAGWAVFGAAPTGACLSGFRKYWNRCPKRMIGRSKKWYEIAARNMVMHRAKIVMPASERVRICGVFRPNAPCK